ncbi:MAG: tetratricopeptide repeat protein [Cyclobacteriaceae bacterium]|nr:tetratricopeptide repeat protein [Cyclobacteriaceae bacterium]
MKKIFGTIALLSLMLTTSYGQKGWKWPEDSATKVKAIEMNVIQSDAVKMGDYRGALPALNWLIANAPDLNKALYINAAKSYDKLAKVEEDPIRKIELADSMLLMYDLRMEYFGDKPNVLNRKVIKAYIYFIKDFSKSEWLLEMFDEAFDIGGSKILDSNIVAYMNVIKVNAKLKKIGEEDILTRYDKISEVIENKMKTNSTKGKSNDSLIKKKGTIDDILTEIVDINCEFVETNLGPKFDENPEDIKLVKRMFKFMLIGKCTDSPLFLSVAKQLQKMEPDYGLCKVVASKCVANKDFTSAITYYNEAIELTDDAVKKSEVYVSQGRIYANQRNKAKARAMYSHAIAADPANRSAYTGIGDLYYHSFKECSEQQDMVKDRLVFIAAYDQYKKAGNAKKMASAKEQFPSKEDLFNGNYEVGQTLSVGCWVNKSVVLKTRD